MEEAKKPISQNKGQIIPKKRVTNLGTQTLPKENSQKKAFPQNNQRSLKPVTYTFAGKRSLKEILTDSIPKEVIPTEKTGYVLGIIFLFVIVISLFQIPLSDIMSGNIDLELRVGTPWSFFVLNLKEPQEMPIRLKGLIGDALIYLVLAYIIDILINVIKKASPISIGNEKEKYPKVFKDQRRPESLAEKVTSKVFSKNSSAIKEKIAK